MWRLSDAQSSGSSKIAPHRTWVLGVSTLTTNGASFSRPAESRPRTKARIASTTAATSPRGRPMIGRDLESAVFLGEAGSFLGDADFLGEAGRFFGEAGVLAAERARAGERWGEARAGERAGRFFAMIKR